jgi:titin
VLYGVGFGSVGASVAGKIAQSTANLTSSFAITIGGVPATVTYSGLAPNLVGLYQFNVVVPAGVGNGDVLVQATLNGMAITGQTLYLPVLGTSKSIGAPTNVSFTAGNDYALVSFTAPGGSGITSYTASCSTASITKAATGTASPFFIGGLTNGSSYNCTVAANTAAGPGAASSPAHCYHALDWYFCD